MFESQEQEANSPEFNDQPAAAVTERAAFPAAPEPTLNDGLPGYRQAYLLPKGYFTADLVYSLNAVVAFWTNARDVRRKDPVISQETALKHEFRNRGYLSWLVTAGRKVATQVTLQDFLSVADILEYTYDYLKAVRKLAPGSLNLHLCSAIIVVKYLADTSQYADAPSVTLLQLRRARNQFVREALRLKVDQKNTAATVPAISWTSFLDGVARYLQEYNTQADFADPARGRTLHNLLLLLYQAVLCPSRGTNIRFLQYVPARPTLSGPAGNYIYYDHVAKRFKLWFALFKNVSSLGVQEVEFPADTEKLPVNALTEEYVGRHLSNLRRAHTHPYFFMGNSGCSFNTSSALTDYFKATVAKIMPEDPYGDGRTGFSTTALRHALVTHVLSDGAALAGDPTLRASIAAAMHHSEETQLSYNTATSVSKKRAAVSYATGEFLAAVDRATVIPAPEEESGPPPKRPALLFETNPNEVPEVGTIVATCGGSKNLPVWYGLVEGHIQTPSGIDCTGTWLVSTARKYNRFKVGTEPLLEGVSSLAFPLDATKQPSGEYVINTSAASVRVLFQNKQKGTK